MQSPVSLRATPRRREAGPARQCNASHTSSRCASPATTPDSKAEPKRESKSRPDAGIVWFEHRGYNQHGDLIHLCHRAGMIMKKPAEAAD
jgi:hypothetical protein